MTFYTKPTIHKRQSKTITDMDIAASQKDNFSSRFFAMNGDRVLCIRQQGDAPRLVELRARDMQSPVIVWLDALKSVERQLIAGDSLSDLGSAGFDPAPMRS